MGAMFCTVIALQHNITKMVSHPEFSKLLHDANLMLDQICVFNSCSCHGARIHHGYWVISNWGGGRDVWMLLRLCFSHSRKERTFCWLRVVSPICKMMASPICSTFTGNHIFVEAVSCDVPQISIVRSLFSSHNSGLRLVTGGTATWLHR